MSNDKVESELRTGQRRRTLNEEELADLKNQLLESIYADIGKSVVKKVLWVFGAVCLSVFAWLVHSGNIKL